MKVQEGTTVVHIRKKKISNSRGQKNFGYFPTKPPEEGNRCYECGTHTLMTHHLVPHSLGGTKVIPICETCHDKIHNMIDHGRLVKEGVVKAKLKGTKFGRPSKTRGESALKSLGLRREGKSMREIAKELNISVGSVHKQLKSASKDAKTLE